MTWLTSIPERGSRLTGGSPGNLCNVGLYAAKRRDFPKRRRRRIGPAAAAGLAILLALGAGPAAAEEIAALYQAYWAGLPAGRVKLILRDDPGGYRDEIGMTTEGISRLATKFRATATSQGRLSGLNAAPTQYDAYYDLRKGKNRRLAMRFVPRGGATFAERGAEDTSQKPPLAEEFRRNVIDPLSALAAIRQGLRDRSRTQFTLPVYDGARRFDVAVQLLAKQPGTTVLPVRLTLRPIAGFKGETSEDGDPDTAPRPVDVTFTDDARLMPMTMSVPLYYLPLTVEFVQWCSPGAACGW